MQSKNLIICDSEEEYADALAQYIMKKDELAFQVQTCSDISYVLSLQGNTKIHYLFISSDYSREERKKLTAEKVFILTGKVRDDALENETVVFKYQPGDEILAELIRSCSNAGMEGEGFLKTVKKKKSKIIGIYSPVHRIGKTSYALELGQKLALEANVLYLSLEAYGGVGGHFAESKETLSDVIYYARQEQSNLGLVLTTIVQHKGRLDYVNPIQVSEDMKTVSAGEWIDIITKIMEQSIYEILILDMDEAVRDIYSVLQICSEIHMLTIADEYARAKVRQFEEELTLLGYEDVRRRIIRKEQNL